VYTVRSDPDFEDGVLREEPKCVRLLSSDLEHKKVSAADLHGMYRVPSGLPLQGQFNCMSKKWMTTTHQTAQPIPSFTQPQALRVNFAASLVSKYSASSCITQSSAGVHADQTPTRGRGALCL